MFLKQLPGDLTYPPEQKRFADNVQKKVKILLIVALIYDL